MPAESFDEKLGRVSISSLWEDQRKDVGTIRRRWVLSEFASTDASGEYFSPTPEEMDVELFHLHAADEKLDTLYLDIHTAFLHAPEIQEVFASCPEGYEKPRHIVQMLRKVNGRRNGSQKLSEWFSVQLAQNAWSRSKLSPSCFTKPGSHETTMMIIAHMDDIGICELDSDLKREIKLIGGTTMLKETGRLVAGLPCLSEWSAFLGRERNRQGDTFYGRPKAKYIDKSCELLGLLDAKPTAASTRTELIKMEANELPNASDHKVVKQAIGILQYIQRDIKLGQVVLRSLASEVS